MNSTKQKEKEQQNNNAKDLSSSSINNNVNFMNSNQNFSHIAKTVKLMGNKSVLIVKPNQYNQENRMSLKKINTTNQPNLYNNEIKLLEKV